MDFVAARIDRVPHKDLAVRMGTTVPGYTKRIKPICKRAPTMFACFCSVELLTIAADEASGAVELPPTADDEPKNLFVLLLGFRTHHHRCRRSLWSSRAPPHR